MSATMTKPATRKSRFSANYQRIALLLSNESFHALQAGDDLTHEAIRSLQNTVSTLASQHLSNEDVLARIEEEKSRMIEAAWAEYDAWEIAQSDMAWTWAEESQRVQEERVCWKLVMPVLEDEDEEEDRVYCKVCGIVLAPHDCPAWDTDEGADDEVAEWEAWAKASQAADEREAGHPLPSIEWTPELPPAA